MSAAKKFCINLLAGLLVLCLFGLATAVAMHQVFGQPDVLKTTLADTGVYDAAADNIVDQTIENAEAKTDLPLDKEAVTDAARGAITPELVQKNSEKIIDGTYSWLHGETQTPQFEINTRQIQDQVAANVAGAGGQRVRDLPACTLAQLQQINPNDIDPFTLPCRPQGYDISAIAQRYQRQVAASDDFFEHETITAETLTDQDGQNVFENLTEVPEVFQFGQKLPWVFGVAAAVLALIILLWHSSKRGGLKTICVSLLLAGGLLLLGALVSSWLLGRMQPDLVSESPAIQDSVLALIRSLHQAVRRIALIFALVYAALGAAGLITARLTAPKTSKP